MLEQVPSGYEPVLQVLETKLLSDGAYRLRMFDGFLRYSGWYLLYSFLSILGFSDCFMTLSCVNAMPVHPSSIIKLKSYTLQDGKKPMVQIAEFENLQLNVPYPREFVHFNGDPDQVSNEIKDKKITLEVQRGNKRTKMNCDVTSLFKPSSQEDNLSRNPRRKQTQHNRSVLPDPTVTPIACLTPFINKWRICGVCTSRESIREVSGAKGPLRVMSFELTDEKGHSIKIVGWNDFADDLNTKISEGDCYYVSGEGCIRKKNARFNSTENEYEISLNSSCQVCILFYFIFM